MDPSSGNRGVSNELRRAFQSDRMVWNGVVAIGGRVFASGPRWAGGEAPALAILGGADLAPYPDLAWNSWTSGADPARAFVNVNAIHLDRAGALWAIDTGAPDFGGDPLPGGPKAVMFDISSDRVARIYPLDEAVRPGSYVDDIRVNGDHAYLTDAGAAPAIIVLDLKSGASRRVLEGVAAVRATPGREVVVGGKLLRDPSGAPLVVNVDPLELSPDGRWFYFGPLCGPWSRIETRLLDDPSPNGAALAAAAEPWADIPPIGGAVMDADGSLYFTELATDSLKRRDPSGAISTVIADPRLHWVDAPFIDADHAIWLPAPQLDRAPPFNGGRSARINPIALYRLQL
jgi:sugar lactone lactonase YvrE